MKSISLAVIALAAAINFSCDTEEDERTVDENYTPVLDPADFVSGVDNPYFTLTSGKVYSFKSQTEDGEESTVVTVTKDTKVILGIACVVVHDVVSLNSTVIEDTYDWYAQDKSGNVWYLGEDTKEFENGKVSSTEGTWEAGVDGAKPGIVMHAAPLVGVPYRQEYYFSQAEDWSKVISTGATVTIGLGMYDNCIVTEEWTPLQPDLLEHKYYAPGIGLIKEQIITGGQEDGELVDIQG